MLRKAEDVRRTTTWYVVRGKEHLRMGSWEDAIHLAKISESPCHVMGEQFYKQTYKQQNEQ